VNDATLTEQWGPPFAKHVLGCYEPRPTIADLAVGELPEQRWLAVCTRCNAEHRGMCNTGAVRVHIARFGALHQNCRVPAGKRGQ
jgi:hypothetical protein